MSNPKLLRGRHSETGAHYAVTIVCADRAPLFLNPQSAAAAIAEIERLHGAGVVVSHAWVVMPDHMHWLFELREGTLGCHMQAFKSRSALAVNRLRGTGGAAWQAGFFDHRIGSTQDLLRQARYIVANPLRKRLVERIEDYPHWHCRWIKRQQGLLL